MANELCLQYLRSLKCQPGCVRLHARSAALGAEFRKKNPFPALVCDGRRCPGADKCPHLHPDRERPPSAESAHGVEKLLPREGGRRSPAGAPRPLQPPAPARWLDHPPQLLRRGPAGPAPEPPGAGPMADGRRAVDALRRTAARVETLILALERLQAAQQLIHDPAVDRVVADHEALMAELKRASCALLERAKSSGGRDLKAPDPAELPGTRPAGGAGTGAEPDRDRPAAGEAAGEAKRRAPPQARAPTGGRSERRSPSAASSASTASTTSSGSRAPRGAARPGKKKSWADMAEEGDSSS